MYEQREVIREHYRLAEELYEGKRCGTMMQKFGINYSVMHPQHDEVRTAFARVSCREDWVAPLGHHWGHTTLPDSDFQAFPAAR